MANEEEKVVEQVEKKSSPDYVMKLPDSEKEEEQGLPPNSPAFWTMRVAAYLIDICLIFLATLGLKTLFDYTPISNGYKDNYYVVCYVADHLKLDDTLVPGQTYALQVYEDNPIYAGEAYKNYTVYTEKETSKKYKIIDIDKIDATSTISPELKKAYATKLAADERYKAAVFNCRLIDYGIVMLAAGISGTLFVFIVPLLNKRRATIGKLFGGIHVINYRYQVTAKPYQILGRTLFIMLFEVAVPQLFLSNAIYTMLTVSGVLALSLFTNKDRRSLNDLISRTYSIDKRTYVPLDEQQFQSFGFSIIPLQ